MRKQIFKLNIDNREFKNYAVFYPVGNGRFNQLKAIEDIKAIMEQ